MAHPRRAGAAITLSQQAHDGSQEALDFRELAVVCRRLTDQKEAAASPASPVSTLVYQQAKTLEEAVCCHQHLVQKRAKASQGARCSCSTRLRSTTDSLADLEAHLSAPHQHVLRFLILEEFHARNPETGRVGRLNALFATRFILQDDAGTDSMYASLGLGGAQQILSGLRIMMDAINPDLSQNGGVRSDIKLGIRIRFFDANTRLEPRYIRPYQKSADTPYRHNEDSGMSKGSFACVRQVKHENTGEVLAMKTFFKGVDRDQIRHEIGILEVCDHPNILKLVEAFSVPTGNDEDDKISIVLRPWAPFTLHDFLNSSEERRRDKCPWFQPGSPQSEMCIYRIMQQLTEAVAYLHNLSIKHKDIKPENILLYEPGSIPPRAIVADVGVSKVWFHGGSTNYDDCSYPYLAPEQVTKRESSLQADVWQLGCCFAKLLAVSKAGTLGHKKLWDSFCLTKDNRSCQIASELDHFMRTLRDICLPGSREDQAAYSLVASMLDPAHETRIDIEGVLASVKRLIQQSEDRVRDASMAGWQDVGMMFIWETRLHGVGRVSFGAHSPLQDPDVDSVTFPLDRGKDLQSLIRGIAILQCALSFLAISIQLFDVYYSF